jgi:pimeloyl-ACP methyl ester carboxylesterase
VLRVDVRHRLQDVTCPILCLHGHTDRLVRRQSVEEIVTVQPRCEVRWLNAPHMLLATHAEAAAKAIEDFCMQLDD